MDDVILTVRLDRKIKERGQAILRGKGYTPSSAVQGLFGYVVEKGELPFEKTPRPTPEELAQRLASFKRFRTKVPLNLSDEEIRAARIGERYGLDA
jgi:antitoxin component of RelBE/YafQ-DinJ toxin-antitoxin module